MRRATNITTYQSDSHIKTMSKNIGCDNLGTDEEQYCALSVCGQRLKDATGMITDNTKVA